MIQVIPKMLHYAGYGGGTQWIGPNDGLGALSNGVGNPESGRIPMPFAGTFRKLASYSRASDLVRTEDTIITLHKNGVATSHVNTLPFGDDGPVISTDSDIAVSALDDVAYKVEGAGPLVIPGYYIGTSIEFEGPGNVFGIAAISGGKGVGLGWIGGAFGNGFWQSYDGSLPTALSTSYSICATAGSVTRLALKAYNGQPGAGVFTAWLKVDGVLQDGSGATVDTTTVLTGTDESVLGSFDLPVTVGQHVDVVVLRSGIDMPFSIASLAAGIGFVPTSAGAFMCCGGSNDSFDNTTDGWKWTRSLQEAPIEENLVTSCSSLFTVNGLYVECLEPGTGNSWTHTLLKDEVATAATVTVADLETSGLIDGLSIVFSTAETMTLLRSPSSLPATSAFYWGLAARIGIDPPGSEVGGGGGGGEGEEPAPIAGSYTRSFECIHADYKRTIPLSGSSLRTFSDLKGST